MKYKAKKYLKIVLYILLGIILFFFSSEIVLNKTMKTTFETLDKTDQQMLRLLSDEYKIFKDRSSEIWDNDFRLDTKPFIAVRTNKDFGLAGWYGYVFNCEGMENMINAKEIKMPAGFSLPKVYRINKLAFGFSEIWIPLNFGIVDFKNIKTYYFKYYPKMITNPVYGKDFSSFSIHEAFHVFKQSNWTYDAGEKSFISDYPYDKEQYALLGLEFKILDKALYNTDTGEVSELMIQWLIVREERYLTWPTLLAETYTEAIEGTAQYTQYQYSKLAGGHTMILGTKEAPYHITFEQTFDYIAENQGISGFLNRDIYYETGAALGMIMDVIAIDWKTKIEDSKEKPGQTQYEIIKNHYDSSEMTGEKYTLEEIKKQYNYDELLVKSEKISRIYRNYFK